MRDGGFKCSRVSETRAHSYIMDIFVYRAARRRDSHP